MAETTVCGVCGRKKGAPETGSFTQWLSGCRCDSQDRRDAVAYVCANCGKPVAKAATGSFTQWVFRPKNCQCPEPSIISEEEYRQTQLSAVSNKQLDFNVSNRDDVPFETERYKPIRQLGVGGMGNVQLCFDTKLNKEVAVKVLKITTNEQLIYFQNEARLTAKLRHSNIISINDFGVTDSNAPYMVLQYVDGISLVRLLEEQEFLDEQTAVVLSIQIASGLEHAHAAGIFHRDIKASNILITDGNVAHVIDFGIAFLNENTDQGLSNQGKTLIGTPLYMSPDQYLGRNFDARSEVYSLGCLIFEMVSGRLPFVSNDFVELLEMHASTPVPKFSEICPEKDISPELEKILAKCLSKEPSDRYQSIKELKQALKELLSDDAHPIDEPQVVSPVKSQSSKFIMIGGSLVFVLVALLAVPTFMPRKLDVIVKQPIEPIRKTAGTKSKVERDAENASSMLSTMTGSDDFEAVGFGDITYEKQDKGTVAHVPVPCPPEDLKGLSKREDVVTVSFQTGSLKNINEAESNKVDLSNIQMLAKLPNLIELNLTSCELSDEVMDEVSKFKKLNYINFNRSTVDDRMMTKVAMIKNLMALRLRNTPGVTAKGILNLKPASKLIKLDVTIDDKPEEYFKAIGALNLDRVVLYSYGHAAVPPNCFHYFKTIEKISLDRITVQKPHIRALYSMPKLSTLITDATGITDSAVKEMKDLPIDNLELRDESYLSDACLPYIRDMKNLKVFAFQMRNVHKQALLRLKSEKPSLILVPSGKQAEQLF